MKATFRLWQLSLLLFTILVVVACKGSNDQVQQNTVIVPSTPSPTAARPPTRIIQRTPSPTLPPMLTPTLNFPVWRYASEWALNLHYAVTGGGLYLRVDHWVYSGTALIEIAEDGRATGRGTLWPSPYDEQCVVTPLAVGAGFGFAVEGTLVFDGARILLEIEVIPDDYEAIEEYQVECPNNPQPRHVTGSYLWPLLYQTGSLHYTFWVEENHQTLTYDEDLAARTNSVLRGTLHAEVSLQR